MVLVDTNVLAFVVLDGPQTESARQLFARDADWRSDAYALIELSNVLVTAMRVRGAALAAMQTAFATAGTLIEPGLLEVAHADAMAVAQRYRITAYDARFLVAAQALGVKLTTEDVQLRRVAPDLTRSLAEALAD